MNLKNILSRYLVKELVATGIFSEPEVAKVSNTVAVEKTLISESELTSELILLTEDNNGNKEDWG